MKKLYIDITESYAWEGEVTGIIRVMDELSSRFAKDTSISPNFVIWDEAAGVFRSVEFNDMPHLAPNGKISKQSEFETNQNNLVSPENEKSGLSQSVKRIFKARTGKAVNVIEDKPEAFINDNAVLFMPHGGVWGSDKYVQKLFVLQESHNVSVAPILYDLCPVVTPQFCSAGVRKIFNNYMSRVLSRASLVLAISENTASDAKTWTKSIGAGEIKAIDVFRLGDEISTKSSKPQEISLPGKYVLCVGTIEARKNHISIYLAYKLAHQQNIKLPPLLIVGRKGWLAEDIYEIMITDPEIKDSIIFMHNATDDELAWLYQNAEFSVYPSFYEGWGLPVAESLLHGVPCIASDQSSIPEIAGDLIEYFSPFSPAELLTRIQNLITDQSKLSKMRDEIAEKYRATSWDESYQQVFKALQKL